MSNFRQDIIEALIFSGALSASELADDLNYDYEDVYAELVELRIEGLVRNADGESGKDRQYRTPAGRLYRADTRWIYCGGPISQALSTEEQRCQL